MSVIRLTLRTPDRPILCVWESNIGVVIGHPRTDTTGFDGLLEFAEEIGLFRARFAKSRAATSSRTRHSQRSHDNDKATSPGREQCLWNRVIRANQEGALSGHRQEKS